MNYPAVWKCCLTALLFFCQTWLGQAAEGGLKTFALEEVLLVPLRVHLLSATNAPAVATTLEAKDIDRILRKVNRVWLQAGFHFYLESLVREKAANSELYEQMWRLDSARAIVGLRPPESWSSDMFHMYYVKHMMHNGVHFKVGNFVKDTASLRPVEGGIEEPLPRVTSHELGHALTLQHRQNETNLMASGTSGTALNPEEVAQAREAAERILWIEPVAGVLDRAEVFYKEGRIREAAHLYRRLLDLGGGDARIELARERSVVLE